MCFFFSSRRRHTRCALVTGVQTCALPIFIEEARKTIRQAEQTELVGRQAGRGELGRIEIGYMTSSTCAGIVARCLLELHRKHPLVELRLQKLETPQQLSLLAERRIDAGFVRPPEDRKSVLSGQSGSVR